MHNRLAIIFLGLVVGALCGIVATESVPTGIAMAWAAGFLWAHLWRIK